VQSAGRSSSRPLFSSSLCYLSRDRKSGKRGRKSLSFFSFPSFSRSGFFFSSSIPCNRSARCTACTEVSPFFFFILLGPLASGEAFPIPFPLYSLHGSVNRDLKQEPLFSFFSFCVWGVDFLRSFLSGAKRRREEEKMDELRSR